MDLHKNASQLGQVDLFHGEDHTMTNYIKNYIKNHSKIAARRPTQKDSPKGHEGHQGF
jgi:DNA-directed RNA polymerase subunit L